MARAQRELDVHPHSIGEPHVVGKSGTGWVSVGSAFGGYRKLEVPFDRLGDYDFTRGGRVLVCGRDNRTDPPRGILVAAEPNGRTYRVLGSYAEEGADFVGVAWDEATSQLYLLDAASGRILTAPHAARAAPPQRWEAVVTAAECPVLAASSDFVLDLVHENGMLVGFQLWHDSAAVRPMLEDSHVVRLDGTAVRTESHVGLRYAAHIVGDHHTVGQTEVEVRGPPDTKVAVVQVFGDAILGRGVTDADGEAIVPVTPLGAGHVFHAVNLDHPGADATYAGALYRWGASEDLPSGHRVARFRDALSLATSIGDSFFSVALRLEGGEKADEAGDVMYHAVLAVGTPDGVTKVGERTVLRPLATMRCDARILKAGSCGDGEGFGSVDLPIPDRAGLAGGVLAFQWWVFASPDDVRVSEVAATVLRDETWAPRGSEAFFGLDRPARGFTEERPWNVWSRAALELWLADHAEPDTDALVDRVFTLMRR